jgi:poly(3-hydroxybutyrate) depolymerase
LFLTFVAAAVVASGACGGFTQEERVAAPVLGPFTPPTRPTDAEIAWFHYDASVPLDAIERGREQLEGVERIDLTYASPHGGRVPAWVYEPDQTGPLAGIVVMHGMPGSRDTRWEMAAAYARSGAVVIAISAPFARPDGPRDRPITLTAQDRDEQVQLIVDLRRAVDYLQAHPQVDPERIGYVGVSYGGAMGGLLAGVEPRVKAYALMVGDGGLVAHLTGPDDNVEAQTPAAQWRAWLGAMEPIEPLRFVGLASSEVLFQNGLADELVPVADGLEYQQAGNELTTSWWYEGGHQMTYRRLRDQVEWLAPRLGIDPERFAL